ncbi:MAG: hypothetical protein ACRD1K_05760, partial [Acidimicrobiales bacterium]
MTTAETRRRSWRLELPHDARRAGSDRPGGGAADPDLTDFVARRVLADREHFGLDEVTAGEWRPPTPVGPGSSPVCRGCWNARGRSPNDRAAVP